MASVDLFINILDQNDNRPEFSRESYTLYIDEFEPTIIPKTIIRVTDKDEGVNSILNFSSVTVSLKCFPLIGWLLERHLSSINQKTN